MLPKPVLYLFVQERYLGFIVSLVDILLPLEVLVVLQPFRVYYCVLFAGLLADLDALALFVDAGLFGLVWGQLEGSLERTDLGFMQSNKLAKRGDFCV